MSLKNLQNFLQLALTNAVTKVCWALTLLLLLRKLGADTFGILATVWASAGIAASFADLGTTQSLLREASRKPEIARRLAFNSLKIQVSTSVAIACLLIIGLLFSLEIQGLTSMERRIVILCCVGAPFVDQLQALFTVCSQLAGNYRFYTRIRSSYFAALLLSISIVAACGGSIVSISITHFSLAIAFTLFMGTSTWNLLPNEISVVDAAHEVRIKNSIYSGLPFLLITALTVAYGKIETAIFGLYGLSATAGSFHVIYQAILLAYAVYSLFFTITFPRLYRHHGRSDLLTEDYRDTVCWLTVIGFISASPLLLFSEDILIVIGNSDLAAYSLHLKILSLLIFIMPIAANLNFLLPTDQLRERIFCDLLGIAISVVLSVHFARQDYSLGIAISPVVGYAASILLAQMFLQKTMKAASQTLLREFSFVGLCAAPGILVAWLMPGAWWFRCIVLLVLLAAFMQAHPVIRQRCRTWLQTVFA